MLFRVTLLFVVAASLGRPVVAVEPPAAGVLHLGNDSFVPGELRPSKEPAVLRWQSPLFARPIDFPLTAVNAAHYRLPAAPAPAAGEYCLELVDDSVLYGSLLGLTDDAVEWDSARTGRILVRRERARRLYRSTGDSVYTGPNGLAGWSEAGGKRQWRDDAGQLFTNQPGASLYADVGIPDKALIEAELSWKGKPDFVLALGVDEGGAGGLHAFHVEVWDGDVVMVGESAQDADLAVLHAFEGRVRFRACLDQAQRRLILLSAGGKPLATLRISVANPQVRPGVRLLNKKGDVRLEHLRVTRWNGLAPREARDDQARVHRVDGPIIYGRLAAFDPRTKQFTVRDGDVESVLPREQVADVFFAPPPAENPVGPPAPDASGPLLRLTYHDGSRYTGALQQVEAEHVSMNCSGLSPQRERGERNAPLSPRTADLAEALHLPLAGLRSLVVLRRGAGPAGKEIAGRAGRLEAESAVVKGRVADAAEAGDASRLVWQPDLALNASPLADGASGRIVYRDPPPTPARPTPRALGMGMPGMGMPVPAAGIGQIMSTVVKNITTPPPTGGRKSLHLRSGDTIPCEVLGINEQGVSIKTPVSSATFVAHEKIKSVELVPTRELPQLDETKRDRLLTLPRMQRDSPPTHLICSRTGDFLRGRIVEMDAKSLQVEVRLETRTIPRERVAQVIWLHADELGDRKTPAAAEPARKGRVQTVRADGNRLTFVLEKSDHAAVAGTSDVLGACRAELADIDQLLFGTSIEQSAAQLAYHRWKLHPAPEPKFAKDDLDAADRLTGTESPLVGQPGYAFKLDLLDGQEYQLAKRKGRIVILDFWATWCGPCLQSMPLVEAVVREFPAQDVELLCVNMEEQPDQIKAMLERHKLKVAVALDRDGVVAARYAVTAIPQTVVLDREGKVARLFVGGGKQTAEALRKAVQELLDGNKD